ncbi:MAG: hypothetical protein QM479_15285 [Pseudomonadota bacterium]
MKITILKLIIISALSLSGFVHAYDFSTKSNDELFDMRDQVRTMDSDSKDAYRTERQDRMKSMDQSERNSLFANNGNQSRKRDGSSGGKQYGKSRR